MNEPSCEPLCLPQIWTWFAQLVTDQLSPTDSLSHELSPHGRVPASLVINLDTERYVASAQVWEHGYLDMECLEIATAATCLREHLDGLTEDSLKAALQEFAAVVVGRATPPEMSE